MITWRDYQGADDLRAMQDLVQRIWSPRSRWHIGDLAWERHSIPGREPGRRTRIWFEEERSLAFGWIDLPDSLDMAVDPARPELAREVLDWFDAEAKGSGRSCVVLASEAHLAAALKHAGFRPDPEAPWFLYHHRDLEGLPEPTLADGFSLRAVRPDEASFRSAAHRAAWSDSRPSRVTAESYARVMECWPYRCDLDWVVESSEGEPAAFALGWLDERNQVGLLEPVGCAPAFRRRGLARAANLAVLAAFRRAGALSAVVCPRGDAGYPAPGELYRSLGFRAGERTVLYSREARRPAGFPDPEAAPNMR